MNAYYFQIRKFKNQPTWYCGWIRAEDEEHAKIEVYAKYPKYQGNEVEIKFHSTWKDFLKEGEKSYGWD